MSITKATNSGLVGTKYNNVSADNYYMEPIASTLVGAGGVASIEFTGIPQGYKHLQIRGIAKSTGAGTEDFNMQLNGITSGYAVHSIYANVPPNAQANSGTSQSAIVQPYNFAAYSGATSIFGAVIYDILDYSNVNKYKTVKTLGGTDLNGSGIIGFYSGLFPNTSPITSIKLYATSNNIAQYSRFSLYGIRG